MCGFFSSNKPTSNAIECRNGSIRKGDRVQTQWERDEGGNDKWFCGIVQEAYENGKVKLKYDDGDDWTGKAVYVLKLGPEHPGLGAKFPHGFDTPNPTPQQTVSAGGMPVQMGASAPQMGMAMQGGMPGYAQPMQQPMQQGFQPVPGAAGPSGGGGMMVNVPAGVAPGQPFGVNVNGQVLTINCPPGAMPGQQIQIQVPATPQMQQMQQMPQMQQPQMQQQQMQQQQMQQQQMQQQVPPMQAWGEVAQVQQQVQQQQMHMQIQASQVQMTPREAPDAAHDRVLAQHAMMLGQTLDRMEETFNFQVECMREDLKKAREQLQALGAAMRR